jgi:hypothetical protein
MSAGQLITGAVVSITVNVVVQVALLPSSSVAVTVIVCTPNPTGVPAAGFWVTVIALVGLQSSLTVTPPNTSGTAARQFVPALAPVGGGQLTLGGVVSVTVNVAVLVTVPVTPAHWPLTTTCTV